MYDALKIGQMNLTSNTSCIFVIVLVNVDIYGLSALRSKKGRANMLQTLVLLEKYNTNIDNV